VPGQRPRPVCCLVTNLRTVGPHNATGLAYHRHRTAARSTYETINLRCSRVLLHLSMSSLFGFIIQQDLLIQTILWLNKLSKIMTRGKISLQRISGSKAPGNEIPTAIPCFGVGELNGGIEMARSSNRKSEIQDSGAKPDVPVSLLLC
jgi:hypothetical protein